MGHTSCVMDDRWTPDSTVCVGVGSDRKLILSIWFEVVDDCAGGWTSLVVPGIAGLLLSVADCELSERRYNSNPDSDLSVEYFTLAGIISV